VVAAAATAAATAHTTRTSLIALVKKEHAARYVMYNAYLEATERGDEVRARNFHANFREMMSKSLVSVTVMGKPVLIDRALTLREIDPVSKAFTYVINPIYAEK
jgi:hypothetical protein